MYETFHNLLYNNNNSNNTFIVHNIQIRLEKKRS